MSKNFNAKRVYHKTYDRPVLVCARRNETHNVPVVLVRPRDPFIWTRDPKLDSVLKDTDSASQELNRLQRQYIRNHLKEWHTTSSFGLLANIHLTIGKQRLT